MVESNGMSFCCFFGSLLKPLIVEWRLGDEVLARAHSGREQEGPEPGRGTSELCHTSSQRAVHSAAQAGDPHPFTTVPHSVAEAMGYQSLHPCLSPASKACMRQIGASSASLDARGCQVTPFWSVSQRKVSRELQGRVLFLDKGKEVI